MTKGGASSSKAKTAEPKSKDSAQKQTAASKQTPQPAVLKGNPCPVCGKKIVIGVLHRVEELADRPPGFRPPGAISAIHLVPLEEIIAAGYGLGAGSKRVRREYLNLLERGGAELEILLDKSAAELTSFMDSRLVEGILRVRQGLVTVHPGYDGVYGRVNFFSENPTENQALSPPADRQLKLF